VQSLSCSLITGRYVLAVLYGENRPKSENLATLTPHSSATVGRRKKLTTHWKLPGPWATTLRKQYLSAVHPMTCSLLWVMWLFDRFSISDFGGKWQLKWKFSKMSSQIPRRDTEIRFVTKFGGNRPLRSRRKVVWFTTQKKLALRGTRFSAHFAQNGPIAPKIPERCRPLICPRTPNLVRIDCVLLDLFRKDWFFGPKSRYDN